MNYFRKLSALFGGALLILIMGACAQTVEPSHVQVTPAETTPQPEKPAGKGEKPIELDTSGLDLDGTVWDLLSIAGVDTNGNEVTLEFSKGTINGYDGCNHFGSDYRLEDGKIILGDTITATVALCQGPFSDLASQYREMLREKGSIFLKDGELIIQTDQGELVFNAPQSASIKNTKWTLNSIRNEQGLVSMGLDQNIFFSIVDDGVNGNGGCNIFGGNVTINGMQIRFTEIFSTRMFCEGSSNREAEFFAVLDNTASYEILRQQLTFFDKNDEIIAAFTADDSSAKATTLFVGPEQVDCVGVAPQKCLLIKENPSDDYTYFYDSIVGFEWEAGYEYELLVNISDVENPPADGSSLFYELVEIVNKTQVNR